MFVKDVAFTKKQLTMFYLNVNMRSIWRCAGFTQFDIGNINLEDNLWRIIQIKDLQTMVEEKRLLPFWIIWMIWKSRNEFLFAQRNIHPREDVDRGTQAVAEWILANPNALVHDNGSRRHLSSYWEPPPPGWLKCNFDNTF